MSIMRGNKLPRPPGTRRIGHGAYSSPRSNPGISCPAEDSKPRHHRNRNSQNELLPPGHQHCRQDCADEETGPYRDIQASAIEVTVPGAFSIGKWNASGRESEVP